MDPGLVPASDAMIVVGVFPILLGETIEPGSSALLADRLIACVQEPVMFGEQRMEVSIALAPEYGASGAGVFKRADLVLYRATAADRLPPSMTAS